MGSRAQAIRPFIAKKLNRSKPAVVVERPPGPRRRKAPEYKSMQLSKRIKHPIRLPSAWRLARISAGLLWRHKWLFIGITLVYSILNIILVTGFSSGIDFANIKSTLQTALGGSAVSSSLAIFAVLIGSSGSSNANAASSSYQLILVLIVSLAVIWALREVMAGSRIRIRDAYYRGMTPLVPFILVLLVIALQLIPFVIGATVYGIVTANGIAVFAAEKVLWALIFGLLALLSVYMISSSIFALYIVTLPDMTPFKALRSARQLVRYRRWTVLRKVLVLPLILLVLAALIMLPVILVVTVAAQWIFFALTMFSTVVAHTYLYSLYRELLNE